MHELQLKQTCLPHYPPLQPVSSGLQRTSSESVWQEQDQLLRASPIHRFWSQMAPTAQGFLLNLNAGGCLSALEYLEKTNAVVKALVSINHLRRAGEEFKRRESHEGGTTQASINVAAKPK